MKTLMRSKKTKMILELLPQSLLRNQLMKHQRKLNLEIIHLYTPGKKRRMKRRRSQKRSPLTKMLTKMKKMKIWNPQNSDDTGVQEDTTKKKEQLHMLQTTDVL